MRIGPQKSEAVLVPCPVGECVASSIGGQMMTTCPACKVLFSSTALWPADQHRAITIDEFLEYEEYLFSKEE